MFLHLTLPFLFLLFGVALIASIFDTLVGGGGLITLPAILMTGLPPLMALGTNKLQSSFGSGSATCHFMLQEPHHLKRIKLGVFCTALGAALGLFTVLHLKSDHLTQVIPPLLFVVLLYALFSKHINKERPSRLPYPLFMVLAGLSLGFYDAFLGPGTGAFWAAAIVAGLGFTIRKATMYAKVFNFTSNLVSLLGFVFAHQVIYSVGLVMAVGQFMGGQIGGYLVLKKGHRLIRPLFIVVVSLLLIALSYKTYF